MSGATQFHEDSTDYESRLDEIVAVATTFCSASACVERAVANHVGTSVAPDADGEDPTIGTSFLGGRR